MSVAAHERRPQCCACTVSFVQLLLCGSQALEQAFTAWARNSIVSAAHCAMATRSAQRRLHRIATAAFSAWRTACTASKRTERLVGLLSSRFHRRALTAAFNALRQNVSNCAASRARGDVLAAKLSQARSRALLQGWQRQVQRAQQFRHALARTGRALVLARLRQAFLCWHGTASETAAARRQASIIHSQWCCSLLAGSFASWVATTKAARQSLQQAGMMLMQRQLDNVRTVFHAWHDAAASERALHLRGLHAVQWRLFRVLKHSVAAWRTDTLERKMAVHRANAMLFKRQKRAATRAWYGWLAAIPQLRQQRLLAAGVCQPFPRQGCQWKLDGTASLRSPVAESETVTTACRSGMPSEHTGYAGIVPSLAHPLRGLGRSAWPCARKVGLSGKSHSAQRTFHLESQLVCKQTQGYYSEDRTA